jgi:hypothetical protein
MIKDNFSFFNEVSEFILFAKDIPKLSSACVESKYNYKSSIPLGISERTCSLPLVPIFKFPKFILRVLYGRNCLGSNLTMSV